MGPQTPLPNGAHPPGRARPRVSQLVGSSPQKGSFIMENPIKMDDLGVPLFSETSILCGSTVCF